MMLRKTLVAVGPEPFIASDPATFERAYNDMASGLPSTLSIGEAWLAIARVLGTLNDGHVGLGFPGVLNAAPRRFPLRFAIATDGALLLARDASGTIPIGSHIVSIEGMSASAYAATALATHGGQTPALHRARAGNGGAWTSIAVFGERPSYDVVWLSTDGAQHNSSIPGGAPSSPATAPSAQTPKSAPADAERPYTFTRIHGGDVGYIDYRRCEDHDRFVKFLGDTLDAITAKPVRAIVVDVRHNGGGDSSLNDELWINFSVKPFKQFGGSISKSCNAIKAEYGREKYVSIYGEPAWNAPDGTILRSVAQPGDDLLVHPANNDPQWYKGPVFLLIGPDTFSSAMSCALAAKDYGLATIVGEETGEPVESTGEVYLATTPTIGFQAYLTTKLFLPPKPHPKGQGVVPDAIVPTTLADLAAGRDPVLDYVLSKI